jgi:hypothetical protein
MGSRRNEEIANNKEAATIHPANEDLTTSFRIIARTCPVHHHHRTHRSLVGLVQGGCLCFFSVSFAAAAETARPIAGSLYLSASLAFSHAVGLSPHRFIIRVSSSHRRGLDVPEFCLARGGRTKCSPAASWSSAALLHVPMTDSNVHAQSGSIPSRAPARRRASLLLLVVGVLVVVIDHSS